MLLNGGGDVLRGDAILLYPLPLALLELFLVRRGFFCTFVVLLIVFINDVCAGLNRFPPLQAEPNPLTVGVNGGAVKGVAALGF